jgi:hypothetical protein
VAELFYPTRHRIKGWPWLIDASQLSALDAAVDQYRSKSSSVAASAGGRNPGVSHDGSRTITFLLRHDKELQTSSFKEAMVHPAAASEIALGFRYEVKLRDTKALLSIEKHSHKSNLLVGESETEDVELNIAVEPRASSVSQELFVVLKDWATDVQVPFWQKFIFTLRPLAWIVLIIWGLIFGTSLFSKPTPNYKEHYKQEARKLLDGGINPGNQQQAIELLLAIEADYSPSVSPPGLPSARPSTKYIVENVIGLLCVAVVAIFPEFCIGIWKGKQRLRW